MGTLRRQGLLDLCTTDNLYGSGLTLAPDEFLRVLYARTAGKLPISGLRTPPALSKEFN